MSSEREAAEPAPACEAAAEQAARGVAAHADGSHGPCAARAAGRACRHRGPHGPHCEPVRFDRVRPRLQRRLFFAFGLTIALTAALVGGLARLLSTTERGLRDPRALARFVSSRLSDAWDDTSSRDGFVRDLHVHLGLATTLLDASGARLSQHGAPCEEPWATLRVEREGTRLGTLRVCAPSHGAGPWRVALGFLTVVAALWAASGAIARRILRPLRRLEAMARRIAEGDLAARSNLVPERHGEFGVLGATMDEMAARIAQQLADQRELLAAVSHELRTPLGHLRVLLDLAREQPQRVRLDALEEEVLELDALVAELLASSRVDFGALETREVDAVELSERALERAGLGLEALAVHGTPRRIVADPTLLARALANVLRNAQTHGAGVERLALRFEPTRVLFAVDDRGPGVAPDERERVFEAFHRGEQSAGSSLGLGLSLVRRIAEAHGGHAWIEDAAPRGARVLFSLTTETQRAP